MIYLPLFGRILVSALFLLSGISKAMAFGATVGYASAFGIPFAGVAIVLSIIIELLGAIFLILGYRTTIAANILALYTILTALIFHRAWGDQTEMVMFLKNLSIAGGLIFVGLHGAGSTSIDNKQRSQQY